jgi:D-serine deaminase-like pyridoxal phosphate-dependent protein
MMASLHVPSPVPTAVEPGSQLDQIDTPALIVDLDRIEANIAAMAALARAHDLALRPHAKAHKIPDLARRQVQAGAVGITCQKLGEAEVMAAAGLTDILVACQIVGAIKVQRLLALARRVRLTTVVDSVEGARPLSDAARANGMVVDTLLEVDVGYHRCGVPPDEVAGLARALTSDCPGLRIRGLMAYEGHIYKLDGAAQVDRATRRAYDLLGDAAARLRAAGVAVECVSVGASAGARVAAAHPAVTELRAGSYIFNDLYQVRMGHVTADDCALSVLATVISARTPDHAVIDAGAKALTFAELPGASGYGLIRGHESAVIDRLADEHGIISVPPGAPPFRVGERVMIVPNDGSVVVNSFSELVGIRAGRVERVWSIAARGCMQ